MNTERKRQLAKAHKIAVQNGCDSDGSLSDAYAEGYIKGREDSQYAFFISLRKALRGNYPLNKVLNLLYRLEKK